MGRRSRSQQPAHTGVLADERTYAPSVEARTSGVAALGDPVGDSWVERFVSGYMTEGPRVRMGMVWFVAVVAACFIGLAAVTLVFGLVAAAAAGQTAAAWRRAGERPNPLVAALGAVLMAVAASFGIAMAGVACLVFVAAAFASAALGSGGSTARAASFTVRSGFFVGIAAVSAVFLARTDTGALIALIVLVSGYEVGDYLVGTGAGNPVEGPVAGIAAVAVLTFSISVFQFPPFETGSAWVFGGLAVALAPLGPFVASALVPEANARVPALRRLDSWLLVGPVWAWMLWSYLL